MHSIYNYIQLSCVHFGKRKEKKKEQVQLPPSMEGQTAKLLERKEERAYIVSLHQKSDKPNSGKKEQKPGSLLSWKIRHT